MSPPAVIAAPLRRAVAVDRIAPVLVAIVACLLARSAMLPGLWFWDTAEAQTVPPLLGVMHPTGFPAYVVLGWLANFLFAPFGEPAFRMNLLSGVLVAVAAGTAVVVARRLDAPPLIAAAAGIGLATTPVVWRIGTHADAHALHLASIALVVLLFVDWEWRVRAAWDAGVPPDRAADRRLVAAAAVFGVALANHQLTLLLIPPIALAIHLVDPDLVRRRRFVATVAGAAILVALLLYLELPLRAGPLRAPLVYGHPETIEGFLYVVLAEQFRGSFVNPFADLLRTLGSLTSLLWDQLGPLLLALPLAFRATWRILPGYALLSGLGATITVAFAIAYDNADIRRYYVVPLFFAWTWLAALGGSLLRRLFALPAFDPDPGPWRMTTVPRRASAERGAWPPWARIVAPLALAAILVLPAATGWRDRWAVVDRSTDRTARTWLDGAFAVLDQDAVVVSWWSYSTTLWYGQLIDGRRPDLLIVDDRTRLDEGLGEVTDVIDAHLGRRPVYLIQTPDDLVPLLARYELEPLLAPDGIWRVAGRRRTP